MLIVSNSSQAEEEFNKAQEVFEDINKELREELPVLYQRLGQLYQPKFPKNSFQLTKTFLMVQIVT